MVSVVVLPTHLMGLLALLTTLPCRPADRQTAIGLRVTQFALAALSVLFGHYTLGSGLTEKVLADEASIKAKTRFSFWVFLAMPLKYIWKLPLAVKVIGMLHGLLFILLVILLIRTAIIARWSWARPRGG